MASAAVQSSSRSRSAKVLPCRPQAAFAGAKTPGFADTGTSCGFGLSFAMPRLASEEPSVTNSLLRAQKSGCFIWALSTTRRHTRHRTPEFIRSHGYPLRAPRKDSLHPVIPQLTHRRRSNQCSLRRGGAPGPHGAAVVAARIGVRSFDKALEALLGRRDGRRRDAPPSAAWRRWKTEIEALQYPKWPVFR
jgi:hypothetical protein